MGSVAPDQNTEPPVTVSDHRKQPHSRMCLGGASRASEGEGRGGTALAYETNARLFANLKPAVRPEDPRCGSFQTSDSTGLLALWENSSARRPGVLRSCNQAKVGAGWMLVSGEGSRRNLSRETAGRGTGRKSLRRARSSLALRNASLRLLKPVFLSRVTQM